MVVCIVAVTVAVLTAKFAEVAFPGTVTLEGTLASEAFPLAKVTTPPEAGAGPSSVTVPCEDAPPRTVAGLRVSVVGTFALTNALFDVLGTFPSLTVAVIVKTGFELEAGGKKVAVAPFPWIVPLSAVHEYWSAFPFTSKAVRDKLLESELLTTPGVATGP